MNSSDNAKEVKGKDYGARPLGLLQAWSTVIENHLEMFKFRVIDVKDQNVVVLRFLTFLWRPPGEMVSHQFPALKTVGSSPTVVENFMF